MDKNKKEYTIYDLARQLNLSPSTISRALQDSPAISRSTKQKILKLAADLGFRTNTYASRLRSKRSSTIGAIVPYIDSFFISSVIGGIETVVSSKGYNLLINQSLESYEKEVKNVQTMYNSRIDGLIISLAANTPNTGHLKPFFERNVPVVFFDRVDNTINCPQYIIDNFNAGYKATAHLIEQGCKNIVYVSGNLLRNVYSDRMEGYRQALSDHSLPFNKKNIYISKLDLEAGKEIAQKLLKSNSKVDGIFIANDKCAIGCMTVLKNAGLRIPDDIAIVGFNNDPITVLVEPGLSTVDYPGRQMGIRVANDLIGLFSNSSDKKINLKTIIPSELIVRESSLRKKD